MNEAEPTSTPIPGNDQLPTVVMAYWDGLELFDETALAKIASVGNIADPKPLSSWDDPRADDLLAQAEVMLGHWGCPPLDAAMLDRAPNLQLFTYAAGTIKNMVSDELWNRDIRVTSGANANAEPVAEFTLAAILMINKDMVWARDRLADPSIAERRQKPAAPIGNWDKTVGIVSASLIGRRVIELLVPFPHLRVALYDPFVSADEAKALGATKLGLDELCATADIVSVHAPLLPATIGLIGTPQLAAMRTGATLINTSRGPIVDHDALVLEASSGRLSAWLDVTEPEPLPESHPLRSLPNVFLTPHQAGSQGSELGRMTDYAIEEIRRWTSGEQALNEITKSMLDTLA